jgi:hypothetical protein
VDRGLTREPPARFSCRSWAATLEENNVNLSVTIGPIIALIAGILILVMPRLLNFIVAIYLIAIGIIGLLGGVKF